jgi:hypothetical protein
VISLSLRIFASLWLIATATLLARWKVIRKENFS